MSDAVRCDVTTRGATREDARAIAEIYNHYVAMGVATFDTARWSTEKAAALVDASPPEGCYVAETEGEIVGWVAARRYSERAGYRHTCEASIYVTSQRSGRGVGTRLYQQFDTHCHRQGIRHAVARISLENPRSIEFHRRCGFEMVGVQKEIGRMHDRWVDVAILQKLFTTHSPADAIV